MPVFVEYPLRSRLWETPPFAKLIEDFHFQYLIIVSSVLVIKSQPVFSLILRCNISLNLVMVQSANSLMKNMSLKQTVSFALVWQQLTRLHFVEPLPNFLLPCVHDLPPVHVVQCLSRKDSLI